MLIRLLLAFTVIPLVELYLLLQIAEATSAAATFLLVIATGIIGSMLAKREGAIAWNRFRSALTESRMPSEEIQDGLMIVFAAALLLTPGVLTDFLGFTMLLPAGRRFLRQHVFARFFRGVQFRTVDVSGFSSASEGGPGSSGSHARPEDQIHRMSPGDRDSGRTIDAETYHSVDRPG